MFQQLLTVFFSVQQTKKKMQQQEINIYSEGANSLFMYLVTVETFDF